MNTKMQQEFIKNGKMRQVWCRDFFSNPFFRCSAWVGSRLNLKGSMDGENQQIEHLKWVSRLPWLYRAKTKVTQQFCSSKPTYSDLTKRVLDLIVSSIALVALSPLCALTAIAIKFDSKGTVFFSQTRIGKNGIPFKFWKFRSMCVDAESKLDQMGHTNEMEGGVLFKIKDDPRITRVGKYIRKYSIDELPQLWNVIVGDMSLVGPRPCLERELVQYAVSDLKRLDVLPGITGEWQISGRSDSSFREQVDLDITYVYERNFMQDIRILLKTIPVVVSGSGAY